MESEQTRIQELVERPAESLSVEIKNWINPEDPNGQAKIVRTALALRNHGGGYLLIGFHDKTLKPDTNSPCDIHKNYHPDKIQSLISKYASENFEVSVLFGSIDDQSFPVICIPAGVTSPVAAKADLISNNIKLISTDEVFVRTIRSHVPSTTKAGFKDWPKIIQTCADNRDADIARFIRRHLSGNIDALREAIFSNRTISGQPNAKENLIEIADYAKTRMDELSSERSIDLSNYGFWDAVMMITPAPQGLRADRNFLLTIDSVNPQLTGWPIWLVSNSFTEEKHRPFVYHDCYEAFIESRFIQFMKYDPDGILVQRSVLHDDLPYNESTPGTELNIKNAANDCIEAIANGISISESILQSASCENKIDVKLDFLFRWSGLKKRKLNNRDQRRQWGPSHGPAQQDSIALFISIPSETATSSIASILRPELNKLFALFDNYEISAKMLEEYASDLLDRKH